MFSGGSFSSDAFSSFELPPAGGAPSFQPAWAARVAPVIGSGLYVLVVLVLVTGGGLV